MSSTQDIFTKHSENNNNDNINANIYSANDGTINETYKLYNKVNFDEIPNKTLYDKLDEYKLQIVSLNKTVKAYEKIINEQKNKIRLMDTKIIKLEEDNANYNNIIGIQEEIIQKSRNITNTLYEHIKKK
jgi:hypothetical protein